MNHYLLGLITLPVGMAVVFACWIVIKAGYLLLGVLGKAGIARFGSGRPEDRLVLAAVVASTRRTLVINKGTTGAIFFTGGGEELRRYQSALMREAKVGGYEEVDIEDVAP